MTEKRKTNMEVTTWYLKISLIIMVFATIIVSPSFAVDPGDDEKAFFNMVEQMDEGSKVLIAVNYGPPARYEMDGSLHLILRELLSRNISVVLFTLTELGVETISMGTREGLAGQSFGKRRAVYGRDYVNLGFLGGGTLGSGIISRSINSGRTKDVFENEFNTIPIMNGIFSFKDFSAFIELSSMKIDGTPGAVILNTLSKEKNVPVIAVVTSDMVAEYLPFKDSGQIDVLIAGSRRMAALESVFDIEGISTSRYSIASVLLIFIIFTIILSNTVFFAGRKSEFKR